MYLMHPTTAQFLIAYYMPIMMGRSGNGANEGIVVGRPIIGPNHWTWLNTSFAVDDYQLQLIFRAGFV